MFQYFSIGNASTGNRHCVNCIGALPFILGKQLILQIEHWTLCFGALAWQNLQDGLNYGLYCLPANGRAGKFLDEERQLEEYPLPGPIGVLEVCNCSVLHTRTYPGPQYCHGYFLEMWRKWGRAQIRFRVLLWKQLYVWFSRLSMHFKPG